MKFAQTLLPFGILIAHAAVTVASPSKEQVAFASVAVPSKDPGSSQDPSSASNVDLFSPSHLELNYMLDFDRSTTSGTVTHTVTCLEDDIPIVYMDVWDNVEIDMAEFWTAVTPEKPELDDLMIGSRSHPVQTNFEVTTPNNNTGQALGIRIPEMPAGTTFYLRLTFRSLPDSRALHWVPANETLGKTKPFVWSLCEMTNCRDWMPLFDTPSNKITYNATVTAPNGYEVHMSGNETGSVPYNDTWTTKTFESTIKMPTYQISLIAGELESVDLGSGSDGRVRITVYAEPPLIANATEMYADVPDMFALAEKYLGPAIFGDHCKFFVMTPDYTMGGMEHINAIQMAMSTLHDDDNRVAIHEITHSWFGNEVTNKNWDHFWINEGINTFAERKIVDLYYGNDAGMISYYNGNMTTFMPILMNMSVPGSDSAFSLFPDNRDDSPLISTVPYDKGGQFMYYIESLLGEENMQAMIRDYIHDFSQQSIDQVVLQEWYNNWVLDSFDGPEARKIIVDTMWDAWVYGAGAAPEAARMDFLDFEAEGNLDAEALALEYLQLDARGNSPTHFSDYLEFSVLQKKAFLMTIDWWNPTADLLARIDNDLGIQDSMLSEASGVQNIWFFMAIKANYFPGLLDMVETELDESEEPSIVTGRTIEKAANRLMAILENEGR